MSQRAAHPEPVQVVELRRLIQSWLGQGITAAQDHCAAMVHTSRRSWQQWERGERRMHPAFWELALIKRPGAKHGFRSDQSREVGPRNEKPQPGGTELGFDFAIKTKELRYPVPRSTRG